MLADGIPVLLQGATLVALIFLICAIVLAIPAIFYDVRRTLNRRVAEDAAPPPAPFNQELDLDWRDLLDRDVSA